MEDGIERLDRERAVNDALEANRARVPGQLTPRQRIAALADEGSFLELGSLTRSQHVEIADATPGDGLLTGWASVGGREIALLVEDPLVLARTDGQVAKQKRLRILNTSAARGTPVVYLADGPEAGLATFPAAQGDLFGFMGRQWPEPAAGTFAAPFVTAVLGPCFGRAAELAVASDLVVASPVGRVGLRPRALDGGGGTALIDCVRADDAAVIAVVRDVLIAAPAGAEGPVVRGPAAPPPVPLADELSPDPAIGVLVDGLFDEGSVILLRAAEHFASGFAALDGHRVVFAVTGGPAPTVLSAADVRAVGRVGRLSRRLRMPIVLMQNTDGYDPAAHSDQAFLTEMGRALEELRTTWAPKLCLVAGHGHVLGTFVMGGRQLGMDYIVALPSAQVAPLDVPVYCPGAPGTPVVEGPWVAAGLGHVDEVVAPSEARQQLSTFIEILHEGRSLPPPEVDRRGRYVDEIPKV